MSSTVLRRYNVRVFGDGSVPMMFAHGFGCDQNMWRFITPAFERSCQIVVFDYPGHGQSDVSAYDETDLYRLSLLDSARRVFVHSQ